MMSTRGETSPIEDSKRDENDNQSITRPTTTNDDDNDRTTTDNGNTDEEGHAADEHQEAESRYDTMNPEVFIHWGTENATRDEKHFRVWYQNPNGIKVTDNDHSMKHMHQYLYEQQVDIACFAETNLEWNHKWVRRKLETTGRRRWKSFQATTSTSQRLFPKSYKPGGTMMFSARSIRTRIVEEGSDPFKMGRWTFQTFKGKGNIKVTFITAYRVTRQSIATAGPATSFFQQYHDIRSGGDDNPNPRKRILQDLRSFIDALRKEPEHEVFISLDANEGLGNRSQIQEFFEETGLLSVHETYFDDEYYDTNPIPATYSRGTTKISFMAGTPRLVSCVRGCYIEALDTGLHSDHRGMGVDFDTVSVFQGELATISPVLERMLHSTSIRTATKYRTEVCERLKHHDVTNRVAKLICEARSKGRFTDRMHGEAERLDQTITESMLHGEKAACAHHYHDAWSPQLIQTCLVLKFWKVVLSGIRNKRDVTPILQPIVTNKTKGLHVNHQLLSQEEATVHYRLALQKAHAAKQNSEKLREQFLAEQAQIKAIQGNQSVESAIKTIREHERKKAAFAHLRSIMKPRSSSAGLAMIKVPQLNIEDGSTEWITIVDAAEIEAKLLERNRQHYGQASQTPFARLTAVFGRSGTSEEATAVLEGNHQVHEYSREVQAILTELRRDPTIPLIESEITLDDFTKALQKWPEKTSTSPSGRHLGHYKSLLLPIAEDVGDEGNTLLKLHHNMLQIAVLRRRPYNRWLKEVEVMLEKDEGDPKIHRLRIICLYEADYNLYLKIMWAHRLVRHAEDYNMLGQAQGGSRPNRATQDISVRKWQTYLYSRITRTGLAAFDNDAKACFDRIVASLALMCSRYYGMPENACEIHGIAIDEMQHYVKTALGISQKFFQSTPEDRLFGSGQGSGGSPPLWLAVITTMFRALVKLHGEGMQFTNPTGTVKVSRTSDAIVDNTTNWVNDVGSATAATEQKLATDLQEQAQTWEKLLYATGGSLELSKCLAYIIVYDWNKGEPQMRSARDLTCSVKVTSGDDPTAYTISIRDPDVAHKTIGTYQCPTGNMTTQQEALQKKATVFAARFKSMSNMPKWKVMTAYKTMFLTAMEYPLSSCTFNKAQSEKIHRTATRAIIGALGVNRMFPRLLAFAPTSLMGIGLHHPYTSQGI